MDLYNKSDDDISSTKEEIQLSAAEESAIEEFLTDPEGSLSSVDLNLFTDSPTRTGKTKKSMAKRKAERMNFKYLTDTSSSDDEEDSQQSSAFSSVSIIDSGSFHRITSPFEYSKKTVKDCETPFNVMPKTNEDDFNSIPSETVSSEDTNVIISNEKERNQNGNMRDSNEERRNFATVTDPLVPIHQPPLQEVGVTLTATPASSDSSGLVKKEPIKCDLETWKSGKFKSSYRIPEGKTPMNIELMNIEFVQSKPAPSTSTDNVIESNNEEAQNKTNSKIFKVKQKIKATKNNVRYSVTVPPMKKSQLSCGIPSERELEEKNEVFDKKKNIATWIQVNLNNKREFNKNNELEGISTSFVTEDSKMKIDEEPEDSLEQMLKDMEKCDNFLRRELKRNRSDSDRPALRVSAPKKKMRRIKRSKNPENHHIYTFFSSMADLVSTFSYSSTLAAKSKVTQVLKEMERELIEWHKDPSPNKPMADFKMSEEDIKSISKKIAYLPYVY